MSMREIILKEDRCKELVSDVSGWRQHQCSRKAVEDGYCKQHNPERVTAKWEKKKAQWKKEGEEREHRNRVHAKEDEALEVVKRIATGVEDPTETARQFIRELDSIINSNE